MMVVQNQVGTPMIFSPEITYWIEVGKYIETFGTLRRGRCESCRNFTMKWNDEQEEYICSSCDATQKMICISEK